jgi:SAM-dependent methyltransferase
MQPMTDWNALWHDLVEIGTRTHRDRKGDDRAVDVWREKARWFDEEVKRRWARPDSSRQYLLSRLSPDTTVLDIGAGTGAWTVSMAPRVRRVTAVEPSPAMVEVMRENLDTAGISNVEIVQKSWPEARVEPHDFSLCSHAMYAYPDLPRFVQAMVDSTRRTCCLVLRAPDVDGLLAEAARHIWGQPADSPNFTIAYNILLQMGIHANVLMEDSFSWRPFTYADLEDALADMKRRFDVKGSTEYDDYLLALLRSRAIQCDGQCMWPNQTRSALVYWHVDGGRG